MALFERGPRKDPLIGKVVGVGLVDEITDRTWVVVDAVDGRVHYAELGLSSKQIAARLGISHRTVENYRAWIMERMDASNVAELVRKVLILERDIS